MQFCSTCGNAISDRTCKHCDRSPHHLEQSDTPGKTKGRIAVTVGILLLIVSVVAPNSLISAAQNAQAVRDREVAEWRQFQESLEEAASDPQWTVEDHDAAAEDSGEYEALVDYDELLGDDEPAATPSPNKSQTLYDCGTLRDTGYSYGDMVEYWESHGRPDSLDSEGTGIPCAITYTREEIEAFWGLERLTASCPEVGELEEAAWSYMQWDMITTGYPALTQIECLGNWARATNQATPERAPQIFLFQLSLSNPPFALSYGEVKRCRDSPISHDEAAYGVFCNDS